MRPGPEPVPNVLPMQSSPVPTGTQLTVGPGGWTVVGIGRLRNARYFTQLARVCVYAA